MNITRRAFSILGPASISTALGARERRLTVIVAQPAGGVTDAFARAVAPVLARELGRVAVIENIAGASGSIAARKLLTSELDGGTVFVGSPSETLLAPLTLRSVRYRATDFRLLGLLNSSPLALYASGHLPVGSLDELVSLAMHPSAPRLSFGSTGLGSLFHLVTARLLSSTGMKATHVPYRGGMPMLMDLQSGTIDFAMLPVDSLLEQMVLSKKLKVLGVTSAQRLPRFPRAAAFNESRSAPRFGHPTIWVGLLIPTALNARLCIQMHGATMNALSSTEVQQAIHKAGGAIPPIMTLPEAARLYAADTLKLQALARTVHIQPT